MTGSASLSGGVSLRTPLSIGGGSGGIANSGTIDGMTFTGTAAAGASASVMKNGAAISSITADSSGRLSYTFTTPQLLIDSIAFSVNTPVAAGVARTLSAPTPTGTTFDPAGAVASEVLSNGNLTVTNSSGGSSQNIVRTLLGVTSGKHFITFTANTIASGAWQAGIVTSAQALNPGFNGLAGLAAAIAVDASGNVYTGTGFSTLANLGRALITGDVIGIAIDQTNNRIWVSLNGTWFGNGGASPNPATNVNGATLPVGLQSATLYGAAAMKANTCSATINANPASPPAGFSGITSTSGAISVLIVAGQSNAQGLSDDAAAISYTADPLTVTWDGGKFVDYVPNSRTGFSLFNGFDYHPGPEYGYAAAFRAANPSSPLVIIKPVAAGTQLASSGSLAVYDWSPSSAGELYPQAKTFITNALSALSTLGYTAPAVTVLWVQGENDASDSTMASNYQTNLSAFVTSVRSDWGLGTGNFIIARVRSAFSFSSTVRAAQFNVAAANPGGPVGLIETSDLAVNAADNTHYRIVSLKTLGQRAYQFTLGSYTEPSS